MKTDREKLIDTLTALYSERDFYKHLAEELIKEKQKRIRDEKGVITYGQVMFVHDTIVSEVADEDNIEEYYSYNPSEVTVDPENRCNECVCSTCFNTICTGCPFEEEKCDGCVILDQDIDEDDE